MSAYSPAIHNQPAVATAHFRRSTVSTRPVAALFTRTVPTPLGPLLAVADDLGLLMLGFTERPDLADVFGCLRRSHAARDGSAMIDHPQHPHLRHAAEELAAYFSGALREFTVPLAIAGSGFASQAWAYLRTIPFGQTRSYGQQARAMGVPQAARAVGRANGANLLPIIIPCHRIISGDGTIGGYHGGVARKRWLLDHEMQAASQ